MGLNACINGQCKAYPWNHASQPATNTANGCVAWDYLDDADTNTYWQWKCTAKNWGSEAICKAKKIDEYGVCPSDSWTIFRQKDDMPQTPECESWEIREVYQKADHMWEILSWQCVWSKTSQSCWYETKCDYSGC